MGARVLPQDSCVVPASSDRVNPRGATGSVFVGVRRARKSARHERKENRFHTSDRRPWSHIPASYPSGQYCKTISHGWGEAGLLSAILRELYGDDAARMLDEARRQTPRYAERSPWQPSSHEALGAMVEQEAQR